MFIFFAYLEPQEWLNNADFALNAGKNFIASIQGNRIACHADIAYKENFDNEVRKPAILAMNCIALSQAAQTWKTLTVIRGLLTSFNLN